MPQSIGDRVRHLRERQGISQYALAHRLGISTTAIQLLEANSTTNPRADRVVALARYFAVSTDYLHGLSVHERCASAAPVHSDECQEQRDHRSRVSTRR